MLNFFYHNGLRIGNLFKIPIYLHFSTLIFFAFILVFNWLYALSFIGVMLFVLVHEFGHVLMARYYGWPCDKIVLTPLGGIAFLRITSNDQKKHIMVTAAGPLTSLMLSIWCVPLFVLSGGGILGQIFMYAAIMNFLLFAFNCLPIGFLDGGRLFYQVLRFTHNEEDSKNILKRITTIGAITIGLLALISGNFACMMIMLFILLSNRNA